MSDLVAWLTKILDEDEQMAGALQAAGVGCWPGSAPILADIAAKRAIIEMHTGFHECPSLDDNCGWITDDRCSTLLLLASAYTDRPGYDESWRP